MRSELNIRTSMLLIVIMILASAHVVASASSAPVLVPQASIDRLDYPSHVLVGEAFEITIAFSYSYFPYTKGDTLSVVVERLWVDNTGHVTKHADLAWKGGWNLPDSIVPRSEQGSVVETFELSLDDPGHVSLRATVNQVPSMETWEQTPASTEVQLTYKDFSIDASSVLPDLEIRDIQYVKPPETIAVGESTPVVVKVRYSNPYEPMLMAINIYDLSSGSWEAGIAGVKERFSGTGTYTFSPLSITPRSPGDWELRVMITADFPESGGDSLVEATRDITISVEPAFGGVQITNVVVPSGTIAVGELFPVTVTAKYSDLAGGTKLMLWFKDQDTGEQLQVTTSSGPLSGSGTYTFKAVNPKARTPGDWHLKALVDIAGDTVASKTFTIKVVGAPVGATVQITSVKIPPGTLKVSESAPITVKIKYENLAPGTKLTVYIQDEDAHKKLKSVTSILLSGSGTYSFPNIIVTPTKAGSWHLSAGITDHPETRTLFTITVVQ